MKFLNITGMQNRSVELAYNSICVMIEECSDTIRMMIDNFIPQDVIDGVAAHRDALVAARNDFIDFFGIKEIDI